MPFSTIFILAVLAASRLTGAERLIVGLAQNQNLITGTSIAGPSPDSPTILIVGGLGGEDSSSELVAKDVRGFEAMPEARRRFRLLAVPLVNPSRVRLIFPPQGRAYQDNPESHSLWRWIGTEAPDLVLVAGGEDFGLADALAQNNVAGMGRIPARRVSTSRTLLDSVPEHIAASEAHRERDRRIARQPIQVAQQLAAVYGQTFEQAVYIPAMALIGRIRFGQIAEVERIVAPFRDGARDSLAKATGSHFAGHLAFGELAERTGDRRYTELVRKAADSAFFESGEMREAMPLHEEMSDSVFMACPILAKAGKLTGDRKYFTMALRHLRFMQHLCLRADGIYRHSPLDETAWGRGNGFPALGLALALSDTPRDHPAFDPLLRAYRDHVRVLIRFQDQGGMWRQVIDVPGAYPEFTATAMIAAAIERGIRSGWIDPETFQERVDRAWRALTVRIAPDGTLLNVCESTGKQRSLEDYLHRVAIFDRDPRGGGMALFLATELAALPR